MGWKDKNGHRLLLPFTTSLDAIVAEIEARGLCWGIMLTPEKTYSAQIETWIAGTRRFKTSEYPTAPLALCTALLAYLKEGKP
jgi:hypothetical protein